MIIAANGMATATTALAVVIFVLSPSLLAAGGQRLTVAAVAMAAAHSLVTTLATAVPSHH